MDSLLDLNETNELLSQVDGLHLERKNSMFAAVKSKMAKTKDNIYDFVSGMQRVASIVIDSDDEPEAERATSSDQMEMKTAMESHDENEHWLDNIDDMDFMDFDEAHDYKLFGEYMTMKTVK